MIRIHIPDPPENFEETVVKPGANAIALLNDQPLPYPNLPGVKQLKKTKKINGQTVAKTIDDFPYWIRCLKQLHRAYHGICAYTCFRIERLAFPNVEHFIAKTRNGHAEAYEWKNFRLACGYVNAAKHIFADILDPAEIQDGWFQLDLYTLKVKADTMQSTELQAQITATIMRLKLDGYRVKEMRRHMLEHFRTGRVTLAYLEMDNPFLYKELLRQGIYSGDDLPTPAFLDDLNDEDA